MDPQLSDSLLHVIASELEEEGSKALGYNELTAHSLNNFVASYAKYKKKCDPKVLNTLVSNLYHRKTMQRQQDDGTSKQEVVMRKIPPKWICESLWAFGLTGIKPTKENFTFIKDSISDRIDDFNARDLVMTLYSLYRIESKFFKDSQKLKVINVGKTVKLLVMKIELKKGRVDKVQKDMMQEMNWWTKKFYDRGCMSIFEN